MTAAWVLDCHYNIVHVLSSPQTITTGVGVAKYCVAERHVGIEGKSIDHLFSEETIISSTLFLFNNIHISLHYISLLLNKKPSMV